MNFITHMSDHSSKVLTTHVPRYTCSHMNKIPEKSQETSNVQSKSIDDYPHVLLSDQHIRDLTDVYRREKDFLQQQQQQQQQNKDIPCKQIYTNTEVNLVKQYEPKYYIKEHFNNLSCNCETSFPRRIFQNFINGIKMSIEFFLFMGYTITRRNELLECYYPFDRHQSYNCQVNYNYPFVHRPTYNHEMKKLNTIRRQLNRKYSPMKQTMTNTYYDLH